MKSDLLISEKMRRKRERVLMVVSGILIVLLGIIEYYLIAGAGPLPVSTNILIFSVLNTNILLILFLCYLIIRNLVKLIFEDRTRILGTRLRTRLVLAFVTLSLLPTLLLFFVSFMFLRTSLEYWFDTRVEASLDNALKVGQTYYDDRITQLKHLARLVESEVDRRCISENGTVDYACLQHVVKPSVPLGTFTSGRTGLSFSSVELFNQDVKRAASKTWLPLLGSLPKIPREVISRTMLDGSVQVYSSTLINGELIRILTPVRTSEEDVLAVLSLGHLIPEHVSRQLDQIRIGYEGYKQLHLFQQPIKTTLLVTLFLITILIVFVSIWFGFRLAKSITEPIQNLAEATYRVAQGELDFRLEVSGGDELSSLVRAFNTMTQDLKEARTRALKTSRELMESYAEIKQRRRYMEIILQNVNAGIISFDRNGIIRTMNRAAESILKMSAASIIGKPYKMMLTQDQFQEFEEIRKDLARSAKGTIQRPVKMVVDEKELSLLVNFTLLRDNENRSLGIVIVFEDLTELEKIQRLAAWREVARRIAHEVKNPLTPIQLSAQRLRKRYLRALDEDTGAVLDKCTNTIIDQVEELKHLVNEFSNFARMPAPRLVPTRLEELARKVLVMYGEGHPSFEFKLDSEENLPEVFLDPDQVKRALINLLDNAVAALSSGGKITVRIGHQSSSSEIFISVIDTGTGIPHEERHRLFEPDFSRRPGGTGLGLAIVNSIMSDHNGRIEVEDNIPNGSKFTLFFPIDQAD